MENEKVRSKAQIIGDAVCGLLMLTCIIVYLIIGAVANIWHPTWIIIVAGAIMCGVISIISNTVSDLKKVSNDDSTQKE